MDLSPAALLSDLSLLGALLSDVCCCDVIVTEARPALAAGPARVLRLSGAAFEGGYVEMTDAEVLSSGLLD